MPMLREALDFLDALHIDVTLEPVEGTWRLFVRGEALTTGDLVARAVALGMLGVAGVQ